MDKLNFIAMEYYSFILNRTYHVSITEYMVSGAKVHGIIAAESKEKRNPANLLAVKGNLNDPSTYVKNKHIEKLNGMELQSEDFLKVDKNNFQIKKNEILSVRYNPKKKWGMGNYPHDGRIEIVLKNGKKRELIILGNQSGKEITKILENWMIK